MQRSAVQPHLKSGPVEDAFPLTRATMHQAFGRWKERPTGEPLDIARATKTIGFRVLARILFGYSPTWEEAEAFADAVTFAAVDVMDRLLSVVAPPLSVPIERNAKLKAAMHVTHEICARMLRAAEEGGGSSGTYLEAILRAARTPPVSQNGRVNVPWARQMMITLLIVGSENPSNTVAWALGLLSQHPDKLRSLVEEIRGSRPAESPDQLPQFKMATRVIHETLRLYPGGWALDRKAARADVIGGYQIPAGSVVLVAPYLMHRNARYWNDPHQFDPDRFLPERRERVPKYAYYPFGGGPHQCLGPKYAYQFMPLFLSEFLRHFDYEAAFQTLPAPQALFTLRPRGGVPLRLSPVA
jgi:cytochrome P450